MRFYSLAFLLGILFLQTFSYLPPKNWINIIFIIAFIIFFYKKTRIISVILLGFGWALFCAYDRVQWTIPAHVEGKTLIATGTVASIPYEANHVISFLFYVDHLQGEDISLPFHSVVKINWRVKESKNLHAGDQWALTVRLKKIYSTLNPGGFDYEARAFEENIRANGYVVDKGKNQFITNHWYHFPLLQIREYIKNKIEKNLPLSKTSPWIIALVVGERQGIDEENWEVLRNTGTNHLMAIAGLHVGLISGFIYALINWLWRRVPIMSLRIPSQQAAAIAALLIAFVYSALAGFSLPTQRACIMLSIFLIIVLLRRVTLAWVAWNIALFLVLFLNPFSVLTESFWLSFSAVALIIYGISGRLAPKGLWWKWGRIQWVIGLGLIPLSLGLFQQGSLTSFFANSIAIPWVGFLVVPLSLLGTFLLLFSAKLGSLILILADKILNLLWIILSWFAHLSWSSWYQAAPNYPTLIIACVGMVLLLLPIGFPGRYLGIIWLLPLFFYKTVTLKENEIGLTLLDVGQGLATIVKTKNHLLIFDAGPKLSPSYDMGENVIIPYLRAMGANTVDMLVVSHGDNDHIGGAFAILKRLPVSQIKTSVPEKLPSANTSYCLRGEAWSWDGVHFQFLHPDKEHLNLNNDSSCVLKISNESKSILLTGDIEKIAEKDLVSFELKNLSADILVAPHHGSKTSGEDNFLQAVHPAYVLFPVGYRNRYHFPNIKVLQKYEMLKAIPLNTAESGAIQFLLNQKIYLRDLYRTSHKKYWNN